MERASGDFRGTMRRNVQLLNYERSHLFYVDRHDAHDLLSRGVACIVSEKPRVIALTEPPAARRQSVHSRHPSPGRLTINRKNKLRGRGTLLHGGRQDGVENELLAMAAGDATTGTREAIAGWRFDLDEYREKRKRENDREKDLEKQADLTRSLAASGSGILSRGLNEGASLPNRDASNSLAENTARLLEGDTRRRQETGL
jgi:hypothetical protein